VTQESLFAPEPPAPKMQVRHWGMPAWFPHKLSHRDDPQTSKDAAEKMVESGDLTRQAKAVLAAWTKYGPGTSYQIGERSGLGYYVCARRRNDIDKYLEKTGKIIDGRMEYGVKISSK